MTSDGIAGSSEPLPLRARREGLREEEEEEVFL